MNGEDGELMLFEFVNSWDLINEERRTEHDDETGAANTSDTWRVRSGSQQSLLLEVC